MIVAHFTRHLEGGPFVNAVFHISEPRLHALLRAGLDPPSPVQGRALLDTGASCSCVDPEVTEGLSLEPRGREDVLTPSTGDAYHTTIQYDISIIIPPASSRDAPLVLEVLPVIHSRLLQPQGIHALIGRDVLSRCILNYNGTGYFSLAW